VWSLTLISSDLIADRDILAQVREVQTPFLHRLASDELPRISVRGDLRSVRLHELPHVLQ
jgi:hypothetical protein